MLCGERTEGYVKTLSMHLWLKAFDTLPVSDIAVASFEPVAALEKCCGVATRCQSKLIADGVSLFKCEQCSYTAGAPAVQSPWVLASAAE